MGSSQSTELLEALEERTRNSGRLNSSSNAIVMEPIKFHSVRRKTTVFIENDTVALSKSAAVVFSSRTIPVREVIRVKAILLQRYVLPTMSIGFTNTNPATLGPLLQRNVAFNGARTVQAQNVLAERAFEYFVDDKGDVFFRLQGGQFIRDANVKIDIKKPMWAVVDFSSFPPAEVAIEMASVKTVNTSASAAPKPPETNTRQPAPAPPPPPTRNPSPPNHMQRRGPSATTQSEQARPGPSSRHYLSVSKDDGLKFHTKTGVNVSVVEGTIARRNTGKTTNGNCYVFTSQPIRLRKGIVIKVLSNVGEGDGSLGFGLTSCNPGTLGTAVLPNDPMDLLDRPEYWVVKTDIGKELSSLDEVCFAMNDNGEVTFSKNGGSDLNTLMYVDTSTPLWPFFDVVGSTSAIELIGSVSVATVAGSGTGHPGNPDGSMTQGGPTGKDDDSETECVICCERERDTVFYTCGHVCMCFECASTYEKSRGCPICRQAIRDVIRMYKA